MKIENLTIGSDPELFIVNTKTGKVKSSIGIIPGTKDNPSKIDELGEGFALQTDNILAEFNIPPATSLNEFVNNIESMKSYIRNFVKSVNEKYDILCCASQKVPTSELKSKEARMFGCNTDYCIYTGEANPVTKATKTNLRSCGFHLHVGYDNPTIEKSLYILRYMDAVIGLPSIIIDTDAERRKLYGKAGCFRLCTYGFEYRTLSSFWIQSPSHIAWVWNQLKIALCKAKNGDSLPGSKEVQDCIDNNNVERAKELCKIYGLCAEFSV